MDDEGKMENYLKSKLYIFTSPRFL